MKKTLAIVLALAMVLCMIPAAFAGTTKTISDKSYILTAESAGKVKTVASSASGNTVTVKYNYEEEDVDQTGKFTEDKKMALVTVTGFDPSLTVVDPEDILVDGKVLSSNSYAAYESKVGFDAVKGAVTFPVELTKAGYTDSYVITVKGKASASSDEVITEIAKVSVKLVNTAAYKTAKTASIVSVESDDTKWMNAYIVGSKLYLDYVSEPAGTSRKVEVNFADENGAKFSTVTWAYSVKAGVLTVANEVSDNDKTNPRMGNKLDKSAIKYAVLNPTALNGTEIKFELETSAAIYETKKYTVVVRTGIKEADPKGIYFADSTKTIKRGETYVPVVMGVATGKAVTPDKILYGTNTSKEVIDIEDNKKVIGTKEGVAYITAEYTPAKGTKYESSSMKIIVTEGEVAPAEGTTTYYVTCRNLNVRKGAGTSYAKAGMLHRGDKVEVVSISMNWAKLANGTYVSAKYIAK